VEDDRQVRLLLARVLTLAGYSASLVASAKDARNIIAGVKPDIVLLDLGLPDEDGFKLAQWVREKYPSCAILILTGRNAPADRVRGLDGGADDYLAKPFLLDELLARIHSVLRRVKSAAAEPSASPSVAFMDATVDPDRLSLVWPDGKTIQLSVIEFKILSAFAERPGKAVSRSFLLDLIGANDEVGLRSCDYHIFQLRTKLRKAGITRDPIATIRGAGYRYGWPPSDEKRSKS
jgi:DNA-binding response OmpR family regulator